MEDILQENGKRFVIFPIQYQNIWQMYKTAQSAFWTAEELDLSKDIIDWETKLSDNDRYFIKHILAFFAASDGIVNENLALRFMNEIQIPEAKAFYGFQIAMENIHSETYSLLIDTYVKNKEEKNHLFNAIEEIPCIKEKADWALRWISSPDASFVSRLIAFACVEGIFFSGAFCSIFWLKEKGLMPGLCMSNELISRDESLHTEFAILIHSLLKNKVDNEILTQIISEAVEIECRFITDALPCNLLGMNSELMSTYIKFVADRLSIQLGGKELYNAKNPFDFMDRICLEGKTNFFEHRETNYSKANVGNAMEKTNFNVISTDCDF